MERNTLTELDGYEMVPRGSTYIEGISIAFESRNYLVIFTSFVSTMGYLLVNFWVGLAAAVIAILINRVLMSGGKIKDIVDIEYVQPRFEGPRLYVGNIL